MRHDKYRVGDQVEFTEVTDPESTIVASHEEKHGMGPYTVESIDDLPEEQLGWRFPPPHMQIVYICGGVGFSGYWFKPVRG